MSVPSAGRRTNGTVMLCIAALHAVLLLGLAQFGIRPGMARPHSVPPHALRPIQVMLLTDAVPMRDLPAIKSTPAPKPIPAAAGKPQPASAPANTHARRPEPMAVDVLAQDARPGPDSANPAAPPNPGAVDAGPRDAHPIQASAKPAERPPELAPAQAARPDYAYNPQPDYPMLLRDQGVGGVVWLRVWVDREGRPGEIRLARGSGYRLLDDAALRAVRQWRFVPARSGEETLASWVEFPIRFTLNG